LKSRGRGLANRRQTQIHSPHPGEDLSGTTAAWDWNGNGVKAVSDGGGSWERLFFFTKTFQKNLNKQSVRCGKMPSDNKQSAKRRERSKSRGSVVGESRRRQDHTGELIAGIVVEKY